MNSNLGKDNQKKSKRKGYESLLLLLLSISIFIAATYAWFTDSAFSKGNKIFAGNLYVDIIANEESLKLKYNDEYESWCVDENEGQPFSKYVKDVLKYEIYQRKYSDIDGDYDNYYYITDKDASTINLYNVEPGQVRTLRINYLNTGDLAFRAAGALKIDVDSKGNKKSYTGLETLLLQKEGEDVYHNLNAVTNVEDSVSIVDPQSIFNNNLDSDITNNRYYIEEGLTLEEYEYRAKKLLQHQVELNPDGTPRVYGGMEKFEENSLPNEYPINEIVVDGYKYNNLGEHLEDILEVYIIPKVDKYDTEKEIEEPEEEPVGPILLLEESNEANNQGPFTYADPTPEIEITNFDRAWLSKDNKFHDLYYFGNITQFTFLLENGPLASEEISGYTYSDGQVVATGEWLLVRHDAEGNREPITESDIPSEKYMLMYKDASKSLYDDYQRYLSFAGGYTLPKDALTNESGHVIKDGVKVKVYDDTEKQFYMASEIGYTDIVLYMPEDAGSKYQNASISLSLGVTATQVEYEMDDTGYMLYDKAKKQSLPIDDEITKGSHISYKDLNGNEHKFLVLSMGEDGVAEIAELINDDDYLTNYYDSNGDRPRPFLLSLLTGDSENYYQTTDFYSKDGSIKSGIKYDGSNLQNTYERLISSYSDPQSSMHDFYSKLIEQDAYDQSMYNYSSKNIEAYEYSFVGDYRKYTFGKFGDVKTSSNNVLYHPLNIEDVFNCYGYENNGKIVVDYPNIINFAVTENTIDSYPIALADSASTDGNLYLNQAIYSLDLYYSELYIGGFYSETFNICPVFKINLSDINVEFIDNGYDTTEEQKTQVKDGDLIKLNNDNKLYRVIQQHRLPSMEGDSSSYTMLFAVDSIGKTSWTDAENYSPSNFVTYVDDFNPESNKTPFVGNAYGFNGSKVDIMLQKYFLSLKNSSDKKLNAMYQAIDSFSNTSYLDYCFRPSTVVVKNDEEDMNNYHTSINKYVSELTNDMYVFNESEVDSIFLYDDYDNNSILYSYYSASPKTSYFCPCKVSLISLSSFFPNSNISYEDFTRYFLNKTPEELTSNDAMWFNSSKTIGLTIPHSYPGTNPSTIQMLAFGYSGSSSFNFVNANEELQVHPCFYIDLNADGIDYEIIEGENLDINNYSRNRTYAELGDIVKLQTVNGEYKNNSLFRVVNVDDDSYTLIAMDNFNESVFYNSKFINESTYILTNYCFMNKYNSDFSESISTISGPDYLDSDLNNYINDAYYYKFFADFGLNSMKIEDNRIIRDINKSLVREYKNYLYANNSYIGDNSYDIKFDNHNLINVGNANFGSHLNYFRSLSINDITVSSDYFGVKDDESNIIDILFNKDDTNKNQSIWLSDVYYDERDANAPHSRRNICLVADLDNGTVITKNALANEKYSVRPVFTINDTYINDYSIELVVVEEYGYKTIK